MCTMSEDDATGPADRPSEEPFDPSADTADTPAVRTLETGGIDVAERPDGFVVRMDLPGFDVADVDVDVGYNTVDITACRDPTKGTTVDRYLRRQRTTDAVSRTIELPTPVDPDSKTVSYDAGVLTLNVSERSGVDATPEELTERVE